MDRFRYRDTLLAENSIIRKPPRIINPPQLLVLEALAFSCDTLELAFNRALQTGIELSGVEDWPRDKIRSVFIDVWTLVNHLHAVRQLLPLLSDEDESGLTETDFYKETEVARRLRNKMNHLDGAVSNLAAKKNQEPLFGVVCYFVLTEVYEFPDKRITPARGLYTVISAGWQGGDFDWNLHHPPNYQLNREIDLLELHAFGMRIEFSPVFAQLANLLSQLERQLSDSIEAHINERFEVEAEREEMRKTKSGDLIFHVGMEFPLTPIQSSEI